MIGELGGRSHTLAHISAKTARKQELSSEAAGETGVQSSPAQGRESRAKADNCVCAKRVRSREKVRGAEHQCNEDRKVAREGSQMAPGLHKDSDGTSTADKPASFITCQTHTAPRVYVLLGGRTAGWRLRTEDKSQVHSNLRATIHNPWG